MDLGTGWEVRNIRDKYAKNISGYFTAYFRGDVEPLSLGTSFGNLPMLLPERITHAESNMMRYCVSGKEKGRWGALRLHTLISGFLLSGIFDPHLLHVLVNIRIRILLLCQFCRCRYVAVDALVCSCGLVAEVLATVIIRGGGSCCFCF